ADTGGNRRRATAAPAPDRVHHAAVTGRTVTTRRYGSRAGRGRAQNRGVGDVSTVAGRGVPPRPATDTARDSAVQVEPVQLHDLRPGVDEVADELLLRVVAGVDLGE